MPTLVRKQDGQYIVRHFYQDFATWQISPEGVSHLRRRRIEEDGHFTTEQFMHLWMNGWVYTGDHPGPAPGPFCVGDREVPQDLRDAIHEFHSTIRNGQFAEAWRFVSTTRILESLIPKDVLDIIDAKQFEVFQKKMTGANGPRLHSWALFGYSDCHQQHRVHCHYRLQRDSGTGRNREAACRIE